MQGVLKRKPQMSDGWRVFWMVIATLACAAFIPVGAVGALFSPLIFDRQGNILNPLAWISFLLMVGFWIACILGPFAAWVLWSRGKPDRAWAAMGAPLVWALLLLALLQFVPG